MRRLILSDIWDCDGLFNNSLFKNERENFCVVTNFT